MVAGVLRLEMRGLVGRAGAGRCQYLLDAFHAEALACLMGVRATEKLGMAHVLVETDSMLLKTALESGEQVFRPCIDRGVLLRRLSIPKS